MSKEKIRDYNNCLNCDHLVVNRYCSNCGQENVESKKSFHHIFIHFFEDLTHYDNSFWKTIIYLFFKPAVLTKEYMAGKRLTYLAPVRLYIFISFVTFLTFSLFPNLPVNNVEPISIKVNQKEVVIPTIDSLHIEEKGIRGLTKVGIISQKNKDTIIKILQQTNEIGVEKTAKKAEETDFGYKSIKELDSVQSTSINNPIISDSEYWFLKKYVEVKEENTNEQIIEKFVYSFMNNVPKVLFLYMPVFAFVLWLFHDKKKWYYFDHGIFTLHYFSFLLLLTLILFLIEKIILMFESTQIIEWIHLSVKSVGVFWMIYYFFPAHRRFYEHGFLKSLYKSSLIISINIVILSVLVILSALYTFNNIH
ncbi:DUF3667 domain-containing protein [Flavobacterium cellulosilyticum]|uniref:DUF3667 domain-containing protein n=1 Tax=Flavobacterium cellulosilyticum TaxID=2541731 RepID=A0A4R5C842_9FLAO|nr:DUF3667 domain-containing protein [Flavobacterium cellulosilyticum]TDD94293.1 DUF3667 domain-containing protein [Flavobacterium cellulosilyticum]